MKSDRPMHPLIRTSGLAILVGIMAGLGDDLAAIRKALLSGDPDASFQAAVDLTAPGEPGIGPLIEAIGSRDRTARAHAAGVIGSMGLTDPALRAKVEARAVPALATRVGDPDEAVRTNAVGSLGQFGPVAIEPLSRALGEPGFGHSAALAIARFGAAGLPALREGLRSEARTARRNAVAGVAKLDGRVAARALPELLGLFDRAGHGETDRDGFTALAAIGPAARPAAPRLVAILNRSDDWHAIDLMARSVARIGLPAGEIPGLLPTLARPEAKDATWGLTEALASAGAEGAGPLADGLDDGREPVRLGCLDALAKLGRVARPAEAKVRRVAAEGRMRRAALITLVKMDVSIAEFIPTLMFDLKGESKFVGLASSRSVLNSWPASLLAHAGPGAIATLSAALDADDPVLSTSAARALGRVGRAAAGAVASLRGLALTTLARGRGEVNTAILDEVIVALWRVDPAGTGAFLDAHPNLPRIADPALPRPGAGMGGGGFGPSPGGDDFDGRMP